VIHGSEFCFQPYWPRSPLKDHPDMPSERAMRQGLVFPLSSGFAADATEWGLKRKREKSCLSELIAFGRLPRIRRADFPD